MTEFFFQWPTDEEHQSIMALLHGPQPVVATADADFLDFIQCSEELCKDDEEEGEEEEEKKKEEEEEEEKEEEASIADPTTPSPSSTASSLPQIRLPRRGKNARLQAIMCRREDFLRALGAAQAAASCTRKKLQ